MERWSSRGMRRRLAGSPPEALGGYFLVVKKPYPYVPRHLYLAGSSPESWLWLSRSSRSRASDPSAGGSRPTSAQSDSSSLRGSGTTPSSGKNSAAEQLRVTVK